MFILLIFSRHKLGDGDCAQHCLSERQRSFDENQTTSNVLPIP